MAFYNFNIFIKNKNITLTHRSQNPFIPSHISPIIKNKQGARVMYDILNLNDEIPTGKQTWNKTYNFQDKEWQTIYICIIQDNKIFTVTLVSDKDKS